MKIFISLAVFLVPALSLTGAALPGMEDLFSGLAIRIRAPEQAQYVYTDNIKSFYESRTHVYGAGQKYFEYSDYIAREGDMIRNRKKALRSEIRPEGIRVVHDRDRWNEFSLFSGKRAFCITIHGSGKKKLGLIPIIALHENSVIVKWKKGVVTISRKGHRSRKQPGHLALWSGTPFSAEKPDAARIPGLSRYTVNRLFLTRRAAQEFTLYAAYGFSRDDAIRKVRRLVRSRYRNTHKQQVYNRLVKSYLWTDDMDYNRALMWAKLSSYTMVAEEFGKGIWAGLPWFRQNWGRDTFIALPGTLLVSGLFKDAKEVMKNFATYQNLGQRRIRITFRKGKFTVPRKIVMRDHFRKAVNGYLVYKPDHIFCYLDYEYHTKPGALARLLSGLRNRFPDYRFEPQHEKGKNFGRIPNRVASKTSIIYNTTDGTPWFIREVWEYLMYTGDRRFAASIYPVVRTALNGSILNYLDRYGFLTHDDADTWMDARIAGKDPWSARGNRAVDIQVLWHNALLVGEKLAILNGQPAEARKWKNIADRLKKNFLRFFWNGRKRIMADRVRKDGSADFKTRPNQLMLLSVPLIQPLISGRIGALVVRKAVSDLLYPYGIASLSQDHPYFHPYHHHYRHHHDAAYHNGTVWGWNAGFTVSALTRYGQTDLAYRLALNLGNQILNMGCRGSMSELVEAIPRSGNKLKLSGTYSQAWSVSEYARNGYQDFLGFRPDILNKMIDLAPGIPAGWKSFSAGIAFGKNGKFRILYTRTGQKATYRIRFTGHHAPLGFRFFPVIGPNRFMYRLRLQPARWVRMDVNHATGTLSVNGRRVPTAMHERLYSRLIGPLQFRKPQHRTYPALETQGYLESIIRNGRFE